MWFSAATASALKPDCLRAKRDTALSHDNLSHTVMGLVGVQTEVYREALDLTASCRSR